ncbi:MAG: transcription termination/antitermination protein NusG [Mycoplasmatales bacterium]
MEKKWYVVKTFPGYEQKAAERLQRQIQVESMQDLVEDVFYTVQKRYKFTRGKVALKEDILFPGYIFVKMSLTDESFFFVRGIQHITGYSGITSMKQRPKPMTDEEFEKMCEASNKVLVEFGEGTKVNIINHELYLGLSGEIQDVNGEACTVTVKIPDIGQVVLDFKQIELKK